MILSKYPIKKEFYPFTLLTPPIKDPESAGKIYPFVDVAARIAYMRKMFCVFMESGYVNMETLKYSDLFRNIAVL